jgi:hypothetical protein
LWLAEHHVLTVAFLYLFIISYTIMKKKLQIFALNLFFCSPTQSFRWVFILAPMLSLGVTNSAQAQCIGPYQEYQSFGTLTRTNLQTAGWVFNNTSVSPSASNARSGNNALTFGNTAGNAATTPAMVSPNIFQFYCKDTNINDRDVVFKVEWSTDNFVSIAGTLNGQTSSNTYKGYSVDLSAFSNVKVRFTLVSIVGTDTAAIAFFVDDIAWTSTTASQNNIIVPALTGDGATPTVCSGGTVTMATGDTYTLYDNGGQYDRYSNVVQDNTITFKPDAAALAAGDRVRLRFTAYAGAAGEVIDIFDSSTTLDATTRILNHTATTIPTNPTYISTRAADGSLTFKFVSDAVTAQGGFSVTVDMVRCPVPTGVTATATGGTTADVSWTTTATNADVYYNTTGVLPNGFITPTVSNTPGTTLGLTGLTAGATYYVWVRSRCASSPDSYSPWSSVASFATVDCSAFSLSTQPSATTQNVCLNAGATTLTVAATGGSGYTYQWYSNTTATASGGTLLSGANAASYTPVTTAAGTLYYYCVVSSAAPVCSVTSTVSGGVIVSSGPSVAPTANAATGVTSSAFTANWTAVGGVTGYYLDVSTSNTFASFVGTYNNLNVGNVTTFAVTGMTPGTTYYYRVRAFNTCGSTASSGTITVNTTAVTYCTPSGATFSQDPQGITNVTMGTINNTTGIETNNYGNYTAQSTSVFVGATLPFSVTLRTGFGYSVNVWVDWNNDGDFTDAGELVYQGESGSSIPTTLSGSFPVPLLNSDGTSTVGSHRVRVGGIDFGPFTDPCRNGNYQAFEDYTLNVLTVPPCAISTPSALTTVNVAATSASLVWSDSAMTPNTVYNYWVSTTNTAPPADGSNPVGMGSVTGALTANVTGLTLGQTYYFWVRVKCDAATYSAWVGSATFTTVNLDVVNMANGSTTTCNAKFYDAGGFSGAYANNETFTYTFTPASGNNLKVVFNSFSTEPNFDFLSIYDGPTTASPLIGTFSGTQIAAGQAYYSSAANGGSLTFRFTSDFSETSTGWDANITCVSVPTVTGFSPAFACAGATPTITISGTNFTGVTSVTFNGVSAAFTPVNSTTITATLPAGATTGIVRVTTAQAVGSSTSVFTVRPIPATPVASADVAICNGSSTNLSLTTTPLTGSLSTTTAGGNSCTGGNMFNIVTGVGPITITSFDVVPESSGVQSVNVYYRTGTYVGNETNSGAWTLLGTYSINGVSRVPINMPVANLSLLASTTYGIYINFNAAYTNLTTSYSNADLTINTGAGLCGQFSGLVNDRTFNGVVYYQLNAPLVYAWSPATGLSATNIANPVATPTSTQTYSVTTTYNGCTSAADTVVVTVNPKPTVSIPTAGGNVCANSVIPVTSTGVASTFTWTSTVANTLFTDATGTTPYVAGTNATSVYLKTPTTATLTVTATNVPSGCSEVASVTFTVSTKTYNVGFWTPGGPPLNNGTENLVFNSGTYTSTGNLSACSCSVTGATVTMASGHTLSLVNGLTVSSGSMTFESGSSLLQTNPVTNTGNIIYKRDSTPCFRYDYTYWSSPVASQTLIGLSPGTSSTGFFDYSPTLSSWQQSNNTLPMVVGKGYLIRVPSSFPVSPALPQNFTARFTGVPNNGTIPLTIVHNAPSALNLIGNPYPSAINAVSLVTDPGFNVNGNFLGGTIYLWSHNTNFNLATNQYEYNDYAIWNILGGVNTYYNGTLGAGNTNAPNGNIAAGQGFFIKTVASGTAYFRNGMRTGGTTNTNNNFYRSASASSTVDDDPTAAYEKHRIWLDISNNSNGYKQLLLGYIQDGTDGMDRLFDGEMVDNGNTIVMYTKVDDVKLSIQGRGLTFTPNDTFALGYKATVADTYKINLSDFDGLFLNQDIYLEDKLLNVVHNLKEGYYSFSSNAGTFEDRFVLRFSAQALGVPTFNEESVVVYKNALGLHIATGLTPMDTVAVYDVAGRMLASKKEINDVATSFVTLPATQQVLLVKITSDSGKVVTKKLVY